MRNKRGDQADAENQTGALALLDPPTRRRQTAGAQQRPNRSRAAQRAVDRRSARLAREERAAAPPKERRVRTPRRSLVEQVRQTPFVVPVIGLVALGLILTLWLSTRAAQDSYDLTVAKAQNQSLVDKRDSLKRTYESGDSAPELSDKAARLGLVPAGNTARLVVGERGRVSVRGKATAASGRAPRSINPKPVDDALRHIDTSKVDDSTGLPGTGADAAPPQAAQDGGQSADRAAGQAGAQPVPAPAAPNVLPPTPTSDGGAPGPNPRRTAQ